MKEIRMLFKEQEILIYFLSYVYIQGITFS